LFEGIDLEVERRVFAKALFQEIVIRNIQRGQDFLPEPLPDP